jgi:hypothetical protein
MHQLKPGFHGQDGEIGRMIEECLRLAVVQDKRVVDDHEIHVGIAPVDDEITGEKERQGKADQDDGHSAAPAKRRQPGEGIAARVVEGRCGLAIGRSCHDRRVLA